MCKDGGYCAHDKYVEEAKGNFKEDKKSIHKKSNKMVKNIESEIEVDKYYIGKAHCDKKGSEDFDPDDDTTWDLNGIRGRFYDHKKNKSIYGLIPIAIIPKGTVEPDGTKNADETYTLKLEKDLIEHFRDKGRDLLNAKDYRTGRRCSKKHDAFVLYIAFKKKMPESPKIKNMKTV